MLTIDDLEPAEGAFARDLVRLLLDAEPTGEEPLLAVLEYSLRALSGNGIRPVFDGDSEPRWVVGGHPAD